MGILSKIFRISPITVVDVYDDANAIPNKFVNSDGSITTFDGRLVKAPTLDMVEIYTRANAIPNKTLNPDGSIGTFAGGGSGGTSNYNDLANKPKINSVTLSGNKTSTDLGLVTTDGLDNKILELESNTDIKLSYKADVYYLPVAVLNFDDNTAPDVIASALGNYNDLNFAIINAHVFMLREIDHVCAVTIRKNSSTENYIDISLNLGNNIAQRTFKWDGTKYSVNMITNNVLAYQQYVEDELYAVKTNLEQEINNIVINSVVLPQAQIYLSAGGGTANGTFSTTEPTATQTFPTVVSTTPTLRNTFAYTFTQAGFISSLSTWQYLMKLQNLSAQTDYAISASVILIRAGQTDFTLSQLTNFQFETGNQQTTMNVTLPFLSNYISDTTAKLNYAIGDRIEIRLTWNKANGGQQTINIVSTATNPCTFIRNGGEIGSTLVLDNNGVDTKSQAQRNREIESRINSISPSNGVIKADVINAIGTTFIPTDLTNKEFICPSAGELSVTVLIEASKPTYVVTKNSRIMWQITGLTASAFFTFSIQCDKDDKLRATGNPTTSVATPNFQAFSPVI